MVRRRYLKRKPNEKNQPEKQIYIHTALPDAETEDSVLCQNTPVLVKQSGQESCLPVDRAIKILAGELASGGHEDTLYRAAVRLADEGGIIDSCRARWDTEQENASSQSSAYLYDRRQCLELIRYHQKKGNHEALKREKDKLRILEGRLLLGQKPPLRITEEDLEKLEEFIRESGF